MPLTISTTITKRLADYAVGIGLSAVALSLLGLPTQAAGIALIVIGGISRARRSVEDVIRNTSRERDRLQRALDEAEAEHKRFLMARAVVDHEGERLCQQLAKAERDAAERLAAGLQDLRIQAAAEREDLLAEIEDRRSAIKMEGWLIGYSAGERGILGGVDPLAAGATVIHLPVSTLKSDATTAGHGTSQRP